MAGTELTPRARRRRAAAAKRAFRAHERRFLAEGPQAVREALAAHAPAATSSTRCSSPARPRPGTPTWSTAPRAKGVDVYVVSGEVMATSPGR